MKSILSVSKELGLLTVALTLALVANFAYGQWAAPTVAPTGGSVDAPVNTGGVFQNKSGNFSAQTLGGVTVLAITQMESPQFTAGDRMISPLYCDTNGNCFDASDMTVLPTCADDQVLVADAGVWVCGEAPTNSGPTCTTQTQTLTCTNNCPGGWTKTGNGPSVSCNQGEAGSTIYCQRQVCS